MTVAIVKPTGLLSRPNIYLSLIYSLILSPPSNLGTLSLNCLIYFSFFFLLTPLFIFYHIWDKLNLVDTSMAELHQNLVKQYKYLVLMLTIYVKKEEVHQITRKQTQVSMCVWFRHFTF